MLVVARLGHGDDRKNAHEQQEQCRKSPWLRNGAAILGRGRIRAPHRGQVVTLNAANDNRQAIEPDPYDDSQSNENAEPLAVSLTRGDHSTWGRSTEKARAPQ